VTAATGWLRAISLMTRTALLGCVIAGVITNNDAARWAGALIAVLAFKAGYLYARGNT
jgi:fructose-specific phosphotransferase system IIC component